MSGKGSMVCAKCGTSSKEDSSLTFHRFPLPSVRDTGSLKARVWAKYCFPNEDWSSEQSLINLYKKHKMLCGKHFDDSSFTSSNRKRMNKFAIPSEAQHILSELRNKLLNSPVGTSKSQMDYSVTASTSQASTSHNENSIECGPLTQNLHKGSKKKGELFKILE